ncbi:hypothetical protein JTB14_036397 [Gonioctena quinquepunctata]|nr:hypothetical protein JTB14_036397 [Gonioctena quinquepunctata]
MEARNTANLEAAVVESELPSYTIASGLPTYEEALEQLKKVTDLSVYTAPRKVADSGEWTPHTPPTPATTLSVVNLFNAYSKSNAEDGRSVKTTMIV